MNDRIIEFEPLIEGYLIKRYKRFLADIQIDNGEIVTAHCANTGPMKGLLNEGSKVRISFSSSTKRKLLQLQMFLVTIILKPFTFLKRMNLDLMPIMNTA